MSLDQFLTTTFLVAILVAGIRLATPILLAVVGEIITECEAIPLLCDVTCTVIGRGGIFGAEGATTMVVDGDKEEVEKIFHIVRSVKGKGVSGVRETLETCEPGQDKCKLHRACIYKKGHPKVG